MKRRGLVILLVGLIILIWYFTIFGEKGVIKIIELRRERDRLLADISRIEQDNERLAQEIKRLREDADYLESVARRDLGLIRENELLFIFEQQEATNKEKSR